MSKITRRLMSAIVLLALAFGSYISAGASSAPAAASANTYYVATNGNDSNPGTFSQPYLTIQKGLNSVTQAGDTLYIRGGNYSVGALTFRDKAGTSTQPITISGYENERPVLDAAGRISGLWDNFIVLSNLQHVVVKNIEIANSRTKGIYLARSNYVTFQNIWIHHTALAAIWAEEDTNNLIIENSKFWLNNLVNDSSNSHIPTGYSGSWYQDNMWMGTLLVRGSTSSTGTYANNIVIRKNELFQGFGEGINLHGRVSNATIEDNIIYDFWAPAIYFPNCKDILIQRNLVYHTNDPRFRRGGNPGAAIGAMKEGLPTRPGEMKNITIINNFVKGFGSNFFFWQNMGGYLENTLIAHNTFADAHSNTGTANNISIGAGPHINTKFVNNIILQSDISGRVGASDGSIQFSNNLWSVQPASNMRGAGDIYADPKISRIGNTGVGQLTSDYFKILSGSPAIDKATTSIVIEDYFKTIRSSPDIGAFEYVQLVTQTLTPTPTVTPTRTSTTTPTPIATSTQIPPTPTLKPTFTATQIPPTNTMAPTSVPQTPLPGSEVIYDDRDGAFVYSAGWENKDRQDFYKGTLKLTTTKDSSVTFNFTGQSFSIVYRGGPNYGKMLVYVDGAQVGTLDQMLADYASQKRWDYTGQLAAGPHTLKLVFVNVNAPGSLDAVIVRSPSTVPSETPFTPTPIPPTNTPAPTMTPTPVPPTAQPSSETFYDDKVSAFVYSAGWEDKSMADAYNGSIKLTTRNDSSMTFIFTGQYFGILYRGGPNYGKMKVYVDGVQVDTLDQKLAAYASQKRWDYAGQLTPGIHTLQLVFVNSGYAPGSIDAVIVR